MAHSLQGIVSSDKRDKTITVSITSRETHPLYRKQYSHTRKYTAHDEKNQAHLGDRVEIVACRPLSKTKSYKLVKVLEKSHGTVELKDDVTEVKAPAKDIPANMQEMKSASDQPALAVEPAEVTAVSTEASSEGETA